MADKQPHATWRLRWGRQAAAAADLGDGIAAQGGAGGLVGLQGPRPDLNDFNAGGPSATPTRAWLDL